MNIVSTADSGFFVPLRELAKSVRAHYGRPLIVYDLGLTAAQKEELDAEVVGIDVEVDFQQHASSAKGPFIKATHKPFCVKHYWEHHNEAMMLVDADCLFMEKVEESGFDVGVTLRSKDRMDLSDPYSGVLNSGVVFFNTKSTALVDRWIEECRKDNTTDQKALTDLLSESIDWQDYDRVYDWQGLKVKVFRTDEYNDFYLKDGKIFHFKGKRHAEGIYERLMAEQQEGEDAYKTFKQLTGKEKKLWPRISKFLRRV